MNDLNQRTLNSEFLFSLAPAETIDQMLHILLQKLVYNAQRICVGRSIKIECATKKMFYRIGYQELVGGGGIATNFKINAFYMVAGGKRTVINGRCFGSMFIGECV